MNGRIAGWWKMLVGARARKPRFAHPLWSLELGRETALIAGEDRLYAVVSVQPHEGKGSVRVTRLIQQQAEPMHRGRSPSQAITSMAATGPSIEADCS